MYLIGEKLQKLKLQKEPGYQSNKPEGPTEIASRLQIQIKIHM